MVTGVGRGWVSLRVELAQFPGLEDIYNEQWDSGRWLRRYRMEAGRCQIIDKEDNKQVRLSAGLQTSQNLTKMEKNHRIQYHLAGCLD